MKKYIVMGIIGMAASGIAFGAKNMNNNEQLEDQIHGYQKTEASPSQPAKNDGSLSNNQQKEDQVHGYAKTNPTPSEPATVRVGRTNNEQQEDAIHGYSK